MTEPAFLPPLWAGAAVDALAEQIRTQSRIYDQMRGVDPDNPPTIGVTVPVDPEWIAARAEFAGRWQALLDEGYDHDYLENYGDGPVLTDHTTTYEARPNPDFDPNKPNPYARRTDWDQTCFLTIPRASKDTK